MRFTGTFIIVVILFVIVLITSNIIAVKPIQLLTLPFEFLGSSAVILPAAMIIFPISYIVGDVLTEVYGFRIARGVIWLGFGANLLVVIGLWLAGIIPAAGFWEDQDAYDTILGQVPWILLASFVAYLFGEFSNSTVLALLKYKMQGRLLFVRTIGSTSCGAGTGLLHLHLHRIWPGRRLGRVGTAERSAGPMDCQDTIRDGGNSLYLRGGGLHEEERRDGRHRRASLPQSNRDFRLTGQYGTMAQITSPKPPV